MSDQTQTRGLGLPEITIRPVNVADAPAMHAIATDPRVAQTLTLSPAMELPETETWLADASDRSHRLVADRAGQVVGAVTLDQPTNPRMAHSGSLGLMVAHDYWGQGIGSLLMVTILNMADNWLDLKRVELDVYTNNPAAIHLYQKFGFNTEGTRRSVTCQGGRWRDELHMARLRNCDHLKPAEDSPGKPGSMAKQPPPADLTIRPLLPDDLESIYSLWHHPAVARTTMRIPSMEMPAAQRRIESWAVNLHRLVAVTKDQVVGIITIHQRQRPRLNQSAGLGMMVHPDFWDQSIGSKLVAAIVDLADNWLNLKRIELDVNVDNPAGIRLYKKFDFVIEGRKRFHAYGDGRWADSYFMARIKANL